MLEVFYKQDVLNAIDSTRWYHIENGKLISGATSETGLFKADDIMAALNTLKPAELPHERVVMEDPNPTYESCNDCIYFDDEEYICQLRGCIHSVALLKECYQPRKEVVEAVDEAKWVEDERQQHVEKTYHCSNCGFRAWGEYEKTKYCGGCGKKMKGIGYECTD